MLRSGGFRPARASGVAPQRNVDGRLGSRSLWHDQKLESDVLALRFAAQIAGLRAASEGIFASRYDRRQRCIVKIRVVSLKFAAVCLVENQTKKKIQSLKKNLPIVVVCCENMNYLGRLVFLWARSTSTGRLDSDYLYSRPLHPSAMVWQMTGRRRRSAAGRRRRPPPRPPRPSETIAFLLDFIVNGEVDPDTVPARQFYSDAKKIPCNRKSSSPPFR